MKYYKKNKNYLILKLIYKYNKIIKYNHLKIYHPFIILSIIIIVLKINYPQKYPNFKNKNIYY